LLTSHVATITRVGDETSVGTAGVGVDVTAPRVGGTVGTKSSQLDIAKTIIATNAKMKRNPFDTGMTAPEWACCLDYFGV
jgi:hypothetical protein